MKTTVLILCLFLCSVANAQTPNAWGYSTGYGNVYGSFGLAQTMQSMHNVARAQSQRRADRDAAIQKHGAAAVEQAERDAAAGRVSKNKIIVPPARVVRNYGAFQPVAGVDNGKLFADALAETAEEKEVVKLIFTTMKGEYENLTAARAWPNGIAAGLTFFTLAATVFYHTPANTKVEGIDRHYHLVNAALDDIPELATVSNKDKQAYNDMLIMFTALMAVTYGEAKEKNDPALLEKSRKLAGVFIELVLQTKPENIRIENGEIVMK